jgi:hypothetical protein
MINNKNRSATPNWVESSGDSRFRGNDHRESTPNLVELSGDSRLRGNDHKELTFNYQLSILN